MDTFFEGYILKTISYREHGKLMYIYSENGVTSAIARNVKKMNSPLGHLVQNGTLAEMQFSSGKLPTLKEGSITESFLNIKNDLIKQTVISSVHEIIYHNVTKDDNHVKLFAFLKKFLRVLNETDNPLEVLMIFELKLLYFLGYGLNMKTCQVCQSQNQLYFDTLTGNVCCHSHIETFNNTLNEQEFLPLKYYLHVDILKFVPINLPLQSIIQYLNIIDGLLMHYLSFQAKSKKILYTLL